MKDDHLDVLLKVYLSSSNCSAEYRFPFMRGEYFIVLNEKARLSSELLKWRFGWLVKSWWKLKWWIFCTIYDVKLLVRIFRSTTSISFKVSFVISWMTVIPVSIHTVYELLPFSPTTVQHLSLQSSLENQSMLRM